MSKRAFTLLETVIAVALTSQPQKAGFPLTLELSSPKLTKKAWAKISQIRTLSVDRIASKLTRAIPEEVALVLEGLYEIIGEYCIIALLESPDGLSRNAIGTLPQSVLGSVREKFN